MRSVIMIARRLVAVLLAAAAVPALAASPLELTTKMLVEKRIAAADGTTKTQAVSAANVTPGDRVIVVLDYRNTGAQPLGGVVLANPVPRNMVYRGAATGSATPELSVDGSHFAALNSLSVKTPAGATRPATLDDVTHVRWRLSSPLAAGSKGELAFQAVLK
jgi:uncharacterized repeat protein (TIGR01451 family)